MGSLPTPPPDVRVHIREDSPNGATPQHPNSTAQDGGLSAEQRQQHAEEALQRSPPETGSGLGSRLGSGVTLDVDDLEARAGRGQQTLPALSVEGGSKQQRDTPPRLRGQGSLPRPPRPILKCAPVPPHRKGSLDLSSAVPGSGVRRTGSLPSAAIELALQNEGPPQEGPPSISRLVHAASWDVGAHLNDADAPVRPPTLDSAYEAATSPAEENGSMKSSLLGSAPLPSGGALGDPPRRPLARQVSFSPAVGGGNVGNAEDGSALGPMPSLRRSLSRALSWGRDRMNSGWSSYSNVEFCRICHTVGTEEPIIDIGCDCRDGLNLAHLSCITQWFVSRGSNICEICKTEAKNIPAPPPLPPRPVRPRAVAVSAPPPPTSRTAVVGRLSQLLMWIAVGAMLLASVLVIVISRQHSKNTRP